MDKAWKQHAEVPDHLRNVMQGMRQSYSETRLRQHPSELHTVNGKHSAMRQTHFEPHAQAQHAAQHSAQHEPPRISADHQFLSDDDNSGSGSDEDHVGAEARKQHRRIAADHAAAKQQVSAPAAAQQDAQQPHPTASPPVQVVAMQQPSYQDVHSEVLAPAQIVGARCSWLRAIYTAFLMSAQAFNGLSLLDLPVSALPMTTKDGEHKWERLDGSSGFSPAPAPPQSQAGSHSVLPCAKTSPHLHVPVPYQ